MSCRTAPSVRPAARSAAPRASIAGSSSRRPCHRAKAGRTKPRLRRRSSLPLRRRRSQSRSKRSPRPRLNPYLPPHRKPPRLKPSWRRKRPPSRRRSLRLRTTVLTTFMPVRRSIRHRTASSRPRRRSSRAAIRSSYGPMPRSSLPWSWRRRAEPFIISARPDGRSAWDWSPKRAILTCSSTCPNPPSDASCRPARNISPLARGS